MSAVIGTSIILRKVFSGWAFKIFLLRFVEILTKKILYTCLLLLGGRFDFILTQKAPDKNWQTEKKGQKEFGQ